MKSKTKIILGWILVAVVVGIFLVHRSSVKNQQEWEKYLDQQLSEIEVKVKSQWSMSTSIDPMTDKPTTIATLRSQNKASFDFPYEGGSTLTMTLRNKDNKLDVYFTISKGQFVCNEYSGTDKAIIRFDEEEAITYKTSESATHDSDILFIKNASAVKSIIDKCKTAHSIKVQLNFFDEGSRVFEFKVDEPLNEL